MEGHQLEPEGVVRVLHAFSGVHGGPDQSGKEEGQGEWWEGGVQGYEQDFIGYSVAFGCSEPFKFEEILQQ